MTRLFRGHVSGRPARWPGGKASSSSITNPGIDPRRARTPVATLPGAWRYRVSAGTGRPGVSIL